MKLSGNNGHARRMQAQEGKAASTHSSRLLLQYLFIPGRYQQSDGKALGISLIREGNSGNTRAPSWSFGRSEALRTSSDP